MAKSAVASRTNPRKNTNVANVASKRSALYRASAAASVNASVDGSSDLGDGEDGVAMAVGGGDAGSAAFRVGVGVAAAS